MFLGHIRLHKSQRSCPNKLLNAKSKKGRGRTDRVTFSLLELLITAKNPVHEYLSRSLIFFNLMKGVTKIHYIDNFDFNKSLLLS